MGNGLLEQTRLEARTWTVERTVEFHILSSLPDTRPKILERGCRTIDVPPSI